MSVPEVALAALIMATACAVQGAVGFGANLLAAPLLVLIEPDLVPGPLLVAAVVLTGLMVWREPDGAGFRELGWAYAGRLPGNLFGALLLVVVAPDGLAVLFGALILLAVALSAAGLHLAPSRQALFGAGLLSGVMGTTSSVGGPAMVLLYQREPGPRLRGTMARFLTVGSLVSLVMLAAVGELDRGDVGPSLVLASAALAGFAGSGALATRLDRGYTRTAVLVISATAAIVAVVRGIL